MEANDLAKIELDQLINSLITHEMINSIDDDKDKKALTLKASPNDDNEDINEEDFSLLSRNFKSFFTKGENCRKSLKAREQRCHKSVVNAKDLEMSWEIVLS